MARVSIATNAEHGLAVILHLKRNVRPFLQADNYTLREKTRLQEDGPEPKQVVAEHIMMRRKKHVENCLSQPATVTVRLRWRGHCKLHTKRAEWLGETASAALSGL